LSLKHWFLGHVDVRLKDLGRIADTLDAEVAHFGANNIFLLQTLADRVIAAHAAKLTVVVLLHQSMDQYARGLGDTLRNEWAKVQGCFEMNRPGFPRCPSKIFRRPGFPAKSHKKWLQS
jgi:hypothetical protein